MKQRIPDSAIRIMEMLEGAGYEAYLVGGCVRDILLGREPGDFDITTNALPDEVEGLFENVPAGKGGDVYHTVPIGKEHGTIGVIVPCDDISGTGASRSAGSDRCTRPYDLFEVTTYRIDGAYSDSRHPDKVRFTRSLEEDVCRRDLTVNALAMDRQGEVRDYVGGLADLGDGVLRAVGVPADRFQEDALRIMRAVRFEAQLSEYGFHMGQRTEQAIHECRHLLGNIAAERIRAELDKLLVSDGAAKVLRKYRDVFSEFIPELAEGFDFDQQNPYHCYDVYEHILHTVEAVDIIDISGQDDNDAGNERCQLLTIRLAALLHDIGKPRCFVVKEGWGHFYGHEHTSCDMARDILNRLRYDNDTKNDVIALVKAHGTVFNLNERYARRKLNQFGADRLAMLISLERADVSAQAEMVREERIAMIDDFAEIVRKVIADDQCFSLKDLAVNGKDMINIGITEGPSIGRMLNRLLDMVIDGDIANERDVLLEHAAAVQGSRG